jgi:hypothetical protein
VLKNKATLQRQRSQDTAPDTPKQGTKTTPNKNLEDSTGEHINFIVTSQLPSFAWHVIDSVKSSFFVKVKDMK